MKMIVSTTIKSTLDVETMRVVSHDISVEDHDGLSEVSGDLLGAVLIGGLNAATNSVREAYPRAAQAGDRVTEEAGS